MMRIVEYWNCQGIPRGELKDVIEYPNNGGWPDAKTAIKELSQRFKHKVVHVGKDEIAYQDRCVLLTNS